MTNKELMEIAMKYVDNYYDCEDLRYGDDLYNATEEDRDKCINYYIECRDIGMVEFQKKIIATKD